MIPGERSRYLVRRQPVTLSIALLMLIGIVAWSTWLDLNAARNAFGEQVGNVERLASQRILNLETVLVSLAGLYHSSDELNQAELSGFAGELLRAYPFISTIYHAKLLNRDQIEDFLEDMREQGFIGLRLHGRDAALEDATSSHLPIDFVEPMTPLTGGMLGHDLSTYTELAPAIEKAVGAGAIVARGGIKLGKSDTPSYLILKAIYLGRYPPVVEEMRRAMASGLVMLEIHPERFLASLPIPVDIDISINSVVTGHNPAPDGVAQGSRTEIRFRASDGIDLTQKISLAAYGASMQLTMSRRIEVSQLNLVRPLLTWLVAAAILWLVRALRVGKHAARVQAEISAAKIAAQGARFSQVVDNAFDAVITTDNSGRIVTWNRRATAMFGYESEQVAGKELLAVIFTPDAATRHRQLFDSLLDHNAELPSTVRQVETVGRHISGRAFPLELALTNSGAHGEFILSVFARDITRRKRADQKIRQLAYYDTLTKLPNRQAFKELASQAISAAVRHGRFGAVLYLDLDGFKRVNDTLGHDLGDQLLIHVAERLRAQVRASDRVSRVDMPGDGEQRMARLGGDEFTLLLSEIRHPLSATVAARRIQAEIAKPFNLNGHEVYVTPSIGIALFPNDGKTIEDVLKNADTAMYHAKSLGKNNFQFYSDEMNARAVQRLKLEGELRKAMDRGELHLSYQPQIDIAQGRIVATEALLRWTHPEFGNVFPDQFIPIAEETGMIVEIGEWVLQEACRQNMAWQNAGYAPIKVAVNLSPVQFIRRNIQESVKRALATSGMPADLLVLEITESIIMRNVDETIGTLRELRAMGIYISVDDFGTGYSSLSYLKRFPINELKIDRSFTKGIAEDQNDAAITSAIIAMAHQLKLEVVAEGVETREQLDFLRQHDCEIAQGYLISKPLPGSELAAMLPVRQSRDGQRQPA